MRITLFFGFIYYFTFHNLLNVCEKNNHDIIIFYYYERYIHKKNSTLSIIDYYFLCERVPIRGLHI